jgi:hypothetical protein
VRGFGVVGAAHHVGVMPAHPQKRREAARGEAREAEQPVDPGQQQARREAEQRPRPVKASVAQHDRERDTAAEHKARAERQQLKEMFNHRHCPSPPRCRGGGERPRVIQRQDRDALLGAGLVHRAGERPRGRGRRQVVDAPDVPGSRPARADRL